MINYELEKLATDITIANKDNIYKLCNDSENNSAIELAKSISEFYTVVYKELYKLRNE